MRTLLTTLLLVLTTTVGCQAQPTDPAANREIPPWSVPAPKKDLTYVRFLAFGDHGTGSSDQQATADAMIEKLRSDGVRADFVLTTGDNFYSDGVKSVEDSQWRRKFERIYDHALFQVPFHPSLGNHDHKGNVQAQIDYSKRSKRWRMPARYYTFQKDLGENKHIQFFAIDTTPLGWRSNDPAQITWLKAELARSKATWKVVYGHHPLYSHSKRPYNYTLITRLEKILVDHKVDLFVAGHDHTLELLKPIKGVYHVVTGAGGGPRKAYKVRWTDKAFYAATRGGFTLFRVSRKDLVIEFVRMNGKTQYAHVLYKGRSGSF